MTFIGKLFGSKRDPLEQQAKNLVSVAKVNATSLFLPLLEKYPILRDVDVEQFDFFVTIAGVFMASSVLNCSKIEESREDKLMEIVADELLKFDSDGIRAFEDCKVFYESEYDRLSALGHESKFLASDSVGKWIIWNIFGQAPQTQDECELVRATGAMVVHAFFNWWQA